MVNAFSMQKSSKMAVAAFGSVGIADDLAESHLSLVLLWACKMGMIQGMGKN